MAITVRYGSHIPGMLSGFYQSGQNRYWLNERARQDQLDLQYAQLDQRERFAKMDAMNRMMGHQANVAQTQIASQARLKEQQQEFQNRVLNNAIQHDYQSRLSEQAHLQRLTETEHGIESRLKEYRGKLDADGEKVRREAERKLENLREARRKGFFRGKRQAEMEAIESIMKDVDIDFDQFRPPTIQQQLAESLHGVEMDADGNLIDPNTGMRIIASINSKGDVFFPDPPRPENQSFNIQQAVQKHWEMRLKMQQQYEKEVSDWIRDNTAPGAPPPDRSEAEAAVNKRWDTPGPNGRTPRDDLTPPSVEDIIRQTQQYGPGGPGVGVQEPSPPSVPTDAQGRTELQQGGGAGSRYMPPPQSRTGPSPAPVAPPPQPQPQPQAPPPGPAVTDQAGAFGGYDVAPNVVSEHEKILKEVGIDARKEYQESDTELEYNDWLLWKRYVNSRDPFAAPGTTGSYKSDEDQMKEEYWEGRSKDFQFDRVVTRAIPDNLRQYEKEIKEMIGYISRVKSGEKLTPEELKKVDKLRSILESADPKWGDKMTRTLEREGYLVSPHKEEPRNVTDMDNLRKIQSQRERLRRRDAEMRALIMQWQNNPTRANRERILKKIRENDDETRRALSETGVNPLEAFKNPELWDN